MHSPSLAWNLAALLVLLANFCLSAWSVRRSTKRVISCAAAFAYASLSLICLVTGACLFVELEDNEARACWTRTHFWADLSVGMSAAEATRILGPPDQTLVKFDTPRYMYRLRPGGDAGEGELNIEHGRIAGKWPERFHWEPLDAVRGAYPRLIENVLIFGSAVELVFLLVISLIPWNLRRGWLSWPLYLAAAALPPTLILWRLNPARGGYGIDIVLTALITICFLICLTLLWRLNRIR